MTPLQLALLLALALVGLALLVSASILLYGWHLHKRNTAERQSLLKRLHETAEHKTVKTNSWNQM